MGHGDRKVLEDWVAAAIGGALPSQEGTFLVAKPVVGFWIWGVTLTGPDITLLNFLQWPTHLLEMSYPIVECL